MVTKHKQKNREAIRLYIQEGELKEWGLDHVTNETIKKWIRLGMRFDNDAEDNIDLEYLIDSIENKLSRIEKRINNLSKFTAKYLHQLAISTIDLELETWNNEQKGNDERYAEYLKERMTASLKAQKKYFHDIPNFEYSDYFEGQISIFNYKLNNNEKPEC